MKRDLSFKSRKEIDGPACRTPRKVSFGALETVLFDKSSSANNLSLGISISNPDFGAGRHASSNGNANFRWGESSRSPSQPSFSSPQAFSRWGSSPSANSGGFVAMNPSQNMFLQRMHQHQPQQQQQQQHHQQQQNHQQQQPNNQYSAPSAPQRAPSPVGAPAVQAPPRLPSRASSPTPCTANMITPVSSAHASPHTSGCDFATMPPPARQISMSPPSLPHQMRRSSSFNTGYCVQPPSRPMRSHSPPNVPGGGGGGGGASSSIPSPPFVAPQQHQQKPIQPFSVYGNGFISSDSPRKRARRY